MRSPAWFTLAVANAASTAGLTVEAVLGSLLAALVLPAPALMGVACGVWAWRAWRDEYEDAYEGGKPA
ncbi:MAG TPA: hypothetical protein VN088_11800 [Nocardioides sp.]|nr:hypothetical protein [Nocardioides sp.]